MLPFVDCGAVALKLLAREPYATPRHTAADGRFGSQGSLDRSSGY